jgi:signal transduction histidine kinase
VDRVEALRVLSSGNTRERLAAARVLQATATADDAGPLRSALDRETVAWTRRAIEAGLARAIGQPRRGGDVRRRSRAGERDADVGRDELMAQIRDDVVHESSLTLVHILDPIVGSLRVYAAKEVPGFDESQTSRSLQRLVTVLQAIHRLGQASAPPKLLEVNIAALMRDLRDAEFAEEQEQIDLRGPDQLEWVTDQTMVSLIIGVALRNAMESRSQKGSRQVTCEWEVGQDELVLRVSDDGRGPGQESEVLFEPGVTTKSGHAGLGLAIATQAARSLRATLTLRARSPSGALFEARLPRLQGGPGADSGG